MDTPEDYPVKLEISEPAPETNQKDEIAEERSRSEDPVVLTKKKTTDSKSNDEVSIPVDIAEKDDEEEERTKMLIDEDVVKLEIKPDGEGAETPTLPLPPKQKPKDTANVSKREIKKGNPSMYLFPFTRLKLAWNRSSNICDFFLRAICIIFTTLGWFFCVGGVPFVSVVMLIIGSIYVDDCRIRPNIPVYLIVAGVLGTIQHFIAIWTKYLPKETRGRLDDYINYCKGFDYLLHLFLTIWFILGCIWVFGVHSEVEFRDPYKDEYCHKVVYYFAFWILNISFIILAIITVSSLITILCVATAPKKEKGIIQ